MGVVCRGAGMHLKNERDLYRPDNNMDHSRQAGAFATGTSTRDSSIGGNFASFSNGPRRATTGGAECDYEGNIRDA